MSETPIGYQGPLPPNYVQSSTPQTPNIGLTLTGVDPVVAYNFVLIDQNIGGGGGSVKVNGSTVTNPNFNGTTPAAPGGGANITWQVSGSSVSAYIANLFSINGVLNGSDFIDLQSGTDITVTDLGSGQVSFSFTGQLANTNAGGAGLALGSYNAATGNFTTVSVGSGTVTSFSAGALSPLFTTSVATATTTPALSFTLSNAGGGTVFGNNATSSGAPAYTTAPVLGIPGTSTGSIALASSTASGKYTITAPANAATPTLTLPTTTNVLAGQLAGDGTIFSSSLVTASAAGTLTLPTPQNQTANTVFAGPTTGAAAAPTFRALVTADIPNTTITPIWNNLQNATGALTLANAANATTFNQTSAVNWTWANTTAATSGTSQSSPIFNINGTYWTGAASATDSWTIQDVVANGTNGTSKLTFVHSGTTGTASITIPAGASGSPSLQFSGGSTGFWGTSAAVIADIGSSGVFGCDTAGTSFFRIQGLTNGSVRDPQFVPSNGAGGQRFWISGTLTSQAQYSLMMVNNILGGGSLTATSGTCGGVSIGQGSTTPGVIFAPTSGTANFVGLSVNPQVNQTSTSSGNYTGILVNIVETSLKGTDNRLLDLQAGASGGTSEFTITNAGVIKTYAAAATVGQGVASEIVTVDLTAQSAAITATNLTASAPRTGMYRISWSADITTAASSSSVLGGTNGFQIGYTSPTDSVAKTVVSGNSTTSAGNTTATAVAGTYAVYAKTGTAITYAFDYTSVGGTAMVYELHIRLEAL